MRSYPDTVHIRAWQDYVNHAKEFETSSPLHNNYVYRGQADSEWELIPSLLRRAKEFGLTAPQLHEIEKSTLKEFRKDAHLFLPHHKIHKEEDLIAWWLLMQHYGAPTRVLDWTMSAYVALYFAVESGVEKDGAVWVFRAFSLFEYSQSKFGRNFPPKIEDQANSFWDGNAPDELFMLEPKTCTDRMMAQRTAFTTSLDVMADHGKLLAKTASPISRYHELTKIIIPGSCKTEFMRRLREMNVTARTLFPGADGIGRSAAELATMTSHWFLAQAKNKQEDIGNP
jgi:hypothetical protein